MKIKRLELKAKRNAEIRKLSRQGMSYRELASKYKISAKRAFEIVKER